MSQVKGINILSAASEKDGDSHRKTGPKPSMPDSAPRAVTEEHWFLVYFLNSNLVFKSIYCFLVEGVVELIPATRSWTTALLLFHVC